MKNVVLVCFSILFCLASGFVVLENFVTSGISNTAISSGNLTISMYPYDITFPVVDAKWVWNQNWNNSPAGEILTFSNQFHVSCKCKTYTLSITADNGFKAYVNEKHVLSGNDWQTVYSTAIPSQFLNIGENTLQIVGENASTPSAAVIYAIV